MLVRSDFIEKLFPHIDYIDSSFSYYIVVDVKLSKNDDMLPYIKGQLYLYNEALADMQKYDAGVAFILTRSGIVRIGWDDAIKNKAAEALRWLRSIHKVSPNDIRLLPNMKTKNIPKYTDIKRRMAEERHDITLLWNATVEHRNRAFSQGIINLLDPRLNARVLGITGKRGEVVDAFVEAYRSDRVVNGDIDDFGGWRTQTNYYLDIETIHRGVFDGVNDTFVFMIGVGWIEDGEWRYVCLVAERFDDDSEREILTKMLSLIKDKPVFHWGCHERSVLVPKLKRLGEDASATKLYDMNKWFKDNKIIIKGMLNFKLKSVGRALVANGLTTQSWDGIDNGLDAMYLAWKLYEEHRDAEADMRELLKDIIEYNEKDCLMMKEVHEALRPMSR